MIAQPPPDGQNFASPWVTGYSPAHQQALADLGPTPVQALARVLPKDAVVDFAGGCHDGSFFTAQEPPSLAFLARHLRLARS